MKKLAFDIMWVHWQLSVKNNGLIRIFFKVAPHRDFFRNLTIDSFSFFPCFFSKMFTSFSERYPLTTLSGISPEFPLTIPKGMFPEILLWIPPDILVVFFFFRNSRWNARKNSFVNFIMYSYMYSLRNSSRISSNDTSGHFSTDPERNAVRNVSSILCFSMFFFFRNSYTDFSFRKPTKISRKKLFIKFSENVFKFLERFF